MAIVLRYRNVDMRSLSPTNLKRGVHVTEDCFGMGNACHWFQHQDIPIVIKDMHDTCIRSKGMAEHMFGSDEVSANPGAIFGTHGDITRIPPSTAQDANV